MAAQYKNKTLERKEEADAKYSEILAMAQSISESKEQLEIISQDSQAVLERIKQIDLETNHI